MVYAPSPSIPAGMDPKAWKVAIDGIASEAAELGARLSAGQPVGPGMAARIRSLEATGQALRRLAPVGVTKDQTTVAAYALTGMTLQLRGALDALTDSLPPHALASAADLSRAVPLLNPVVSVDALQALAARSTVNITHDWERLTSRSTAQIVNAVAVGMVGGLNPREVASRLKGTLTEAGGMTWARGMLIAQTEMGDLYDSARMGMMRDNPDLYGGWWWRARPDACPICQIKHGMIHGPEEPPQRHHRCRCVSVPIVGKAPGQPGTFMKGEQRTPLQIMKHMPRRYIDAMADAPDGFDWPDLLGLRSNNGWRDSLTLRMPGTGRAVGHGSLTPNAPLLPQPAWVESYEMLHAAGVLEVKMPDSPIKRQYMLRPDGGIDTMSPSTGKWSLWNKADSDLPAAQWMQQVLRADTKGAPLLTKPDPLAKWVGAPKPVAPKPPTAPLPVGRSAFDSLVADAEARYAALGTGKTLRQSFNWSQFERYMDTGDDIVLDQLIRGKYLTSEQGVEWHEAWLRAKAFHPGEKEAYAKAQAAYDAAKSQHTIDLGNWRTANGVTGHEWLGMDGVEPLWGKWEDTSAAQRWMDQHGPRLVGDPSSTGALGLRSYTGSGYSSMNRTLRDAWREGREPGGTKFKAMDQAIPLTEHDFIVRRGTGPTEFRFPPTADESVAHPSWGFHDRVPPPDMQSLVGTVQVQQGYMSTAVGKGGFSGNVELKIIVPKGSRGVWANPWSSHSGEMEFILGRNTQYFVHSVHEEVNTYGGKKWVVEVEVLPEGVDALEAVGGVPKPAVPVAPAPPAPPVVAPAPAVVGPGAPKASGMAGFTSKQLTDANVYMVNVMKAAKLGTALPSDREAVLAHLKSKDVFDHKAKLAGFDSVEAWLDYVWP